MRVTLALALCLCVGCSNQPVEVERSTADAATPFDFWIDSSTASATVTLASAVSVVPVGDVDGDGAMDVAVTTDSGVVLLTAAQWLSDGATTPLVGEGPTAAGDLDDDGLDDVALLIDGDVAVYTGADLLAGGDASATIAKSQGQPVRAVVGGADVDGDGRADLLVSEHIDDARDKEIVHLYSGASFQAGTQAVADLPESFGMVVDGDGPSSMALLGDFDEDGLADVAVGATRNFAGVHTGAGLGSGPLGGLSEQEVHLHDCHPDGCDAGVRVASAGDTDGDGLGDLLITTFPVEESWVIAGALLADETFKTQIFGGTEPEGHRLVDLTGVTAAGDPGGDGVSDLLAVLDSGAVVLLPGQQIATNDVVVDGDVDSQEALPPAERAVLNALDFADLVQAIGVGDVDGDGLDDFAVIDGDVLHLIGTAG